MPSRKKERTERRKASQIATELTTSKKLKRSERLSEIIKCISTSCLFTYQANYTALVRYSS